MPWPLVDIAWVLMHADDIALVAELHSQMRATLAFVDDTFDQRGLEMSIKNTQDTDNNYYPCKIDARFSPLSPAFPSRRKRHVF